MDKKKKFNPFEKRDPDDVVGTVYCDEDAKEYNNILTAEDVFPYQTPLPKYRREPEPPII